MRLDDGAAESATEVVVDDRGYRIVLSHLTPQVEERQPLLIRMLAAVSAWGIQEGEWAWSVFLDESVLASGYEFSDVAALAAARHWVSVDESAAPADERAV